MDGGCPRLLRFLGARPRGARLATLKGLEEERHVVARQLPARLPVRAVVLRLQGAARV